MVITNGGGAGTEDYFYRHEGIYCFRFVWATKFHTRLIANMRYNPA